MNDKMRKICDTLNEYAYEYYTLDNPSVSDGEYDVLYDELVKLEHETGIVLQDSPTRRIGADILTGFEKHAHIASLFSLDKAQDEGELSAWMQRTNKSIGDFEMSLEYKFDGLSINLTYENGELTQAATRGNGSVGEGILAQIITIKSIPLSIPFKGKFEVQGEAIMHISDLLQYNKTADEPLKNPRNGAAGALRNLDPKQSAKRKLDAYFYNIGFIEGAHFENHRQMLNFLSENKFKLSPYVFYTQSKEELLHEIEKAEKKRNDNDFEIDGMVIKVVDFGQRETLGYTQKFPRWAIAYKFKAQEVTTVLENVVWEVGRTGRVSPTALLETVDIGGVSVSRATLNNLEDIRRKNVKIGGRVFIRRSNDVIPEIMGNADDCGSEILPPLTCPDCATKLEQTGPNLFCTNKLTCSSQLVACLEHFVSRNAMNIEGLSAKTLEKLHSEKGVRDIAGLYELTEDDFLSMEGFKQKRANNLVSAISASKTPKLSDFVHALGISNVGRATAEDLAQTFGSLENLRAATFEQLVAIRDIGDIVAQGIVDFFASDNVKALFERLFNLGVQPKTAEAITDGALFGQNIVITGTLENISRKQAGELAKNAGATVQSAVGKSTTILLAGQKAGSKLKKAQDLGIKIINEEEFERLINETGKTNEQTAEKFDFR